MMKTAIPSLLAAVLLCGEDGLAATAAGRIEGKVLGPGGAPAGGAVLVLRQAGRLQPEYVFHRSAVADAGGRFRIEGFDPHVPGARLHAHLPGRSLATAPGGVDADPAPDAAGLAIVLEPASTFRIAFRVPPGLPPAAGAVSLEREEGWEPFAGSEAVLTGLPAGAFGVKYHTDLYGGGVFFTSLPAGGSKDTTIDLAKPDWIEGRVMDGAGSPLEGVLYRADNAFRGMVSRTGKDGVFRIARSRTGSYRVRFRHPLYPDTAISLGRKEPAGLELRLRDGAAPIAGRLAALPGDPRACLVTATPLDPRRPSRARPRWPGGDIRRAHPDSTGAFVVRGMDRETYRLRVDCPGAGSREDTASPGSALPGWTLGPARSLEGRVLSADGGTPIRGFRLGVAGLGWLPEDPGAGLGGETAHSDSLGRFSVSPRFEGVNTVCASAPGHAPACRLVAPDDTLPVEIRLERGLSLAVGVVEASGGGAAVPEAHVRIRRAGSRSPGRGGASDGEGRFAADDMARGEYALDVRAPGRLPFRAVIDLERDDTVQAALLPASGLGGALLDWKGRPARGLRVLARPVFPAGPACPDGIAEAAVAADGSFTLAGLGDCPVTLGVARAFSKATPFLPLYRKDGILPGGDPLEIRLPEPRAWEITPVSAGMPIDAAAEIHVLLPPDPAAGPGDALGHPLGRSTFRGRYTVPAYVGVRYVAMVQVPGYRSRADTVLIPPGDDAYETRMEMVSWPGMRGRITGVTERPAADSAAAPGNPEAAAPEVPGYAGWTVRAPGGASIPVSADGAFRIDGLPAGAAHLALRDGEGRLVWAGAALAGGSEAVLGPRGTPSWVEGIGLDGEGRPVAGAAVTLRRRESPEDLDRAVTDGAGRFRFLVPSGAWLACPGNSALPCTRLRGPGASEAGASGKPEAAGGAGRGGAHGRVILSGSTKKVTVAFALPIPTPSRGSAALIGAAGPSQALEMLGGEALLPSGTFPMASSRRHELVAAAFRPSPATLFWGARVLEADSLSYRMGAPGPAVSVSAADPSGRPLAGVGIRFLPRPDPRRPGKSAPSALPWGEAEDWAPPLGSFGTDADGTLRCLGVEPGAWWVYASHATHACAPLEWKAGVAEAEAISLVLAPGSPIRVKVTYGGFPVAGARAEVFDSLGNRAAPAAAAGDGNLLECGAFRPGRYRVAVTAPGLGRLVRTAEVGEGREANLEASLPAAGWLELVGQDLEDKVFFLKDRNNQVTQLERRAELPPFGPDGSQGGSLLFQGIAPDRYQVWMEGGRKGLGEVEILPAGLTVLDVGRPGKLRMALPAGRG